MSDAKHRTHGQNHASSDLHLAELSRSPLRCAKYEDKQINCEVLYAHSSTTILEQLLFCGSVETAHCLQTPKWACDSLSEYSTDTYLSKSSALLSNLNITSFL